MAAPGRAGRPGPVPGDPRDDPVRQGQLAPQRGHRPRRRSWRARGYALCRVDVRGTGSSGGVALDEYTEAETHDGFDAVEWLAAQPWCTGAVGMWGISYGAFTSIQVAKLRPPHLRAIVPIQGDRRPLPDRRPLHRRLRHAQRAEPVRGQPGRDERDAARSGVLGPGLARALAGAARGDAAVADRVAAPAARRAVLAAAGRSPPTTTRSRRPSSTSAAGWTRTSMRPSGCRRACTAPSRTIVGNWVHGLPSSATPGPNLDELHEMVRFFDRWLKGIENGADAEPAITWFEREYAEPEPFPGRCRADGARRAPIRIRRWSAATGPSRVARCPSWAGSSRRRSGRPRRRPARIATPAVSTGTATGRRSGRAAALSWGAGGPPNGLARDLRPDEAFGPTYTSAPLDDAARGPRRARGRAPPVGVQPGRDRGRPADRRGARRHVGAGQRRDPQPDPSPVARPPGAAGAGTGRGRSASSCGRPATGSCPAIASGSPSPRPRGR